MKGLAAKQALFSCWGQYLHRAPAGTWKVGMSPKELITQFWKCSCFTGDELVFPESCVKEKPLANMICKGKIIYLFMCIVLLWEGREIFTFICVYSPLETMFSTFIYSMTINPYSNCPNWQMRKLRPQSLSCQVCLKRTRLPKVWIKA